VVLRISKGVIEMKTGYKLPRNCFLDFLLFLSPFKVPEALEEGIGLLFWIALLWGFFSK